MLATSEDGRRFAHGEIVRVRAAGTKIRLIDVVGPDGVEGGDVSRHPAHEAREERREARAGGGPAAGSAREHEGEAHVEVWREPPGDSAMTSRATRPGRMTRTGKSILGMAAMSGALLPLRGPSRPAPSGRRGNRCTSSRRRGRSRGPGLCRRTRPPLGSRRGW